MLARFFDFARMAGVYKVQQCKVIRLCKNHGNNSDNIAIPNSINYKHVISYKEQDLRLNVRWSGCYYERHYEIIT